MIQALTWLNMRVKQVGAEETLAGACSDRMEKNKAVDRLTAPCRARIECTFGDFWYPCQRSKGS